MRKDIIPALKDLATTDDALWARSIDHGPSALRFDMAPPCTLEWRVRVFNGRECELAVRTKNVYTLKRKSVCMIP